MSQLTLDTMWLMTAAFFVFFMQAGFAMLEGGLVRTKNAVNVLMKNYIDMGFASVAFWLVGFGLMFGANPSGWFGTDQFMMRSADHWSYTQLFFQMMFAATAATIVSGALAERIRYWAYVVSAVVISSFIYAVYGSWVWGSLAGETSGWLKAMGMVDFAGSSVVHSIGGWCALAGVIVLGPRLGRFSKDGKTREISGHSLPLVALGGLILWVGWFGFNAGSLGKAGPEIGLILLNTHLSGSAGLMGAILALTVSRQPILMTKSLNGGLGGMVAVCAGVHDYEPMAAFAVGLIAGMLVVGAERLLEFLMLDDAVGAVAVHGFCGTWGTLAVAMVSRSHFLDFNQLLIQGTGALAAFVWAFSSAWVVFKVVNLWIGLRADSLAEQRGLDFTEHYEIGYPEFQQALLHRGKD